MRMVPPDQFLPALRRHISGPLDVFMTDALVEAATTFCRLSELIVMTRTVDAAAGDLVEVCDLDSLKACNLRYVADSDKTPLVSGEQYFAMSPNEISALEPLEKVEVCYVAEPLQGADMLPAQLFEDHADDICAGAAAILYAQPDRPWSDPKRSAYYDRQFVEGYRRAFRFRQEHNTQSIRGERDSNPPRKRQFY